MGCSGALGQGTVGSLRRWILLICVDWLPTGLHYVAELAHLYVQGLSIAVPHGHCRDRCRFSRAWGSPHRPDRALTQGALSSFAWVVRCGVGPAYRARASARGISRQAMSQTKPTSSRATATVTTLVFLPERARSR